MGLFCSLVHFTFYLLLSAQATGLILAWLNFLGLSFSDAFSAYCSTKILELEILQVEILVQDFVKISQLIV